MSKLCQKVSG